MYYDCADHTHARTHARTHVVVVRPSRSDEDYFSHPGFEGAGLICDPEYGKGGYEIFYEFTYQSLDRGLPL